MKRIKFCLICLMTLSSICAISSCTKGESENGDNNLSENDSGGNGPTEENEIYVDLGLPSGTLWKNENENHNSSISHELFTYNDALTAYGEKMPTKEQIEELINKCQWIWYETEHSNYKGFYKIYGPNGNFIIMHATNYHDCDGQYYACGKGYYWSSTTEGSLAISLFFESSGRNKIRTQPSSKCPGYAVRLVKR